MIDPAGTPLTAKGAWSQFRSMALMRAYDFTRDRVVEIICAMHPPDVR